MAQNTQPFIPLKYDAKAINRDIPIREALMTIAGITEDGRGKQIRCPSRSHEDKKPSAFIYDKNGQNHCFCFSCQKKFTPIDLALEYGARTFPEACEMLVRQWGLPLSQYSNYDEVVAAQNSKVDGTNIHEVFPLNREDCQKLGIESKFMGRIENPNPLDKESKSINFTPLSVKWANDKEKTEKDLLRICDTQKAKCQELIAADTSAFYSLYALHTQSEWNEAKLVQEAREKYSIRLGSKIRMTEKQRFLANEIVNLYDMADRIAFNEERCKEIDRIADKIISKQAERAKIQKKAQSKPQIDR